MLPRIRLPLDWGWLLVLALLPFWAEAEWTRRYMRSARPCFPGWHLSKPGGTPTLLVCARCNHKLLSSVSDIWFARRCTLVHSGPTLLFLKTDILSVGAMPSRHIYRRRRRRPRY